MTFSDFAKMLYPYCGNNDKTSEFVIILTNAIMEEPKGDEEKNPLADLQIGTLEKIYSGSSKISQRKASAIWKQLYKENFIEYVQELSPDVQVTLGNQLYKLGFDISKEDVGTICANLLAEIIESLAKGVNPVGAIVKVNEPFLHEVGTIHSKESHISDLNLLMEANRMCPSCAKPLVDSKGNNSLSQYQIVNILPIQPTLDETKIFGDLLDSTVDRYSFNNKIPLCLVCANSYTTLPTKEECQRLLDIKARIQRNYVAMQTMEKMPLEKDIEAVLRGISNATHDELTNTLVYTALKIRDKIPTFNVLLIMKTESSVIHYFSYVKGLFTQLQREIGLDFDDIASDVKSSFRKLKKQNLTQDEIFSRLTEWFMNKSNTNNTLACEVIVAFFIQNCEVLDEITK